MINSVVSHHYPVSFFQGMAERSKITLKNPKKSQIFVLEPKEGFNLHRKN
jgi:hypothetical protein